MLALSPFLHSLSPSFYTPHPTRPLFTVLCFGKRMNKNKCRCIPSKTLTFCFRSLLFLFGPPASVFFNATPQTHRDTHKHTHHPPHKHCHPPIRWETPTHKQFWKHCLSNPGLEEVFWI